MIPGETASANAAAYAGYAAARFIERTDAPMNLVHLVAAAMRRGSDAGDVSSVEVTVWAGMLAWIAEQVEHGREEAAQALSAAGCGGVP